MKRREWTCEIFGKSVPARMGQAGQKAPPAGPGQAAAHSLGM